jgi:hypothetical protein
MPWRRSAKRRDLHYFRTSEHWDSLESIYFRDLDLVDIEDDIRSFRRKKTVSKEVAEISSYYSRAYIDKEGRLRRIDELGSGLIPSETYIQYEGDLPVRASRFRLGFGYHGRRVSDGGELVDEWQYRYDSTGRLVELECHEYADLRPIYMLHNELFRHCEYEYDDAGLLRVYQQVHGLSVSGKEWSQARVVIYDRKRNEVLRRHTVSKKALVPSSTSKKPVISFEFGGPAPVNVGFPFCQRCGKSLAYIGVVSLGPPLKNQSKLSTACLFFCFDCLESNSYRLESASGSRHKVPIEHGAIFAEQKILLFRSRDPKEEADAFVKVGGVPDWIHDDEHPSCPECGQLMMFVSQLNSNEQLSNGHSSLMFGDLGRLFTFVCCRTVTNIMQCT